VWRSWVWSCLPKAAEVAQRLEGGSVAILVYMYRRDHKYFLLLVNVTEYPTNSPQLAAPLLLRNQGISLAAENTQVRDT
jgi:hypothetical protein